MASFARGMRLGAGIVGLGWGVYRLSRGRRDWMTTTAITAGLSMTLAGMTGKRPQPIVRQIRSLVNTIGISVPRFQRNVMRMAPHMMATAGQAMMNALT